MSKSSAGIILYRYRQKILEVFLVHPGGPFWAKKDEGAWSIPKGEFEPTDDPLETAIREFSEETGNNISGEFVALQPAYLKTGKKIFPFACRYEQELNSISSNTFEIEWPPKSGRKKSFPEVDKGEWFTIEAAKQKINPGQLSILKEVQKLGD